MFFHWFVECRTSGHKRGGDLFFTSKKRKEKKIEPNWVGPAGLMINTRRLFLKMSATTILLDSEVLDCIGALRARELASEWRRGRKLPIRALTRIFLLRTVTSLFIESRLNRRQRHPASQGHHHHRILVLVTTCSSLKDICTIIIIVFCASK